MNKLSSGAKLTAVERGQDPSHARHEVITIRGKPNGLPFGPSRTASATCLPDRLWIRKVKDAIPHSIGHISQMAEMQGPVHKCCVSLVAVVKL